MGIKVELVPGEFVEVDPDVSSVGGSFFYDPPRVYDPYPLEWTYNELKNQAEPVLYDVGASSGCFTLLAAVIPELRVMAWEPTTPGYEFLIHNIVLNNLDQRVQTFDSAIADYKGSGWFNEVIDIGGLGCSMLGGVPFEGKECCKVHKNVDTLDSWIGEAPPPTLIKIDTEGGELAVLLGAVQTIKLYHPVIVCEYEPLCTAQYGYHPELLVKMVSDLGYRCTIEGTNLFAEFKGDNR